MRRRWCNFHILFYNATTFFLDLWFQIRQFNSSRLWESYVRINNHDLYSTNHIKTKIEHSFLLLKNWWSKNWIIQWWWERDYKPLSLSLFPTFIDKAFYHYHKLHFCRCHMLLFYYYYCRILPCHVSSSSAIGSFVTVRSFCHYCMLLFCCCNKILSHCAFSFNP